MILWKSRLYQEDGLYSMKYNGDYGFDEFLAGGGAASDGEVAKYLTSFLSHVLQDGKRCSDRGVWMLHHLHPG